MEANREPRASGGVPSALEFDDGEMGLGFLMGSAARGIRNLFDRRVKDLGLTSSQWQVLVFLMRENGQTQSQLAEKLDITRGALGELIDRVEAAGFVQRVPDPADRRVTRVCLKPSGRRLAPKFAREGKKLQEELFAGFSAAEQKAFMDYLHRINDRLVELA